MWAFLEKQDATTKVYLRYEAILITFWYFVEMFLTLYYCIFKYRNLFICYFSSVLLSDHLTSQRGEGGAKDPWAPPWTRSMVHRMAIKMAIVELQWGTARDQMQCSYISQFLRCCSCKLFIYYYLHDFGIKSITMPMPPNWQKLTLLKPSI